MPRARSRRHRTDDDDAWASASTDDDLPDWLETSESHLVDLQRKLLDQPRTRHGCDVTQYPAILRRCHFRPFSALGTRLQRQILAKLKRLESWLPYADEALEEPGQLHVLLWLPPTDPPISQHASSPRANDLFDLSQLLDAAELRQTRLADPHRRAAASAVAAAAAAVQPPAASAPTAGPSPRSAPPEPDPHPHLLGFCLLVRRRDPASGGLYNTIEYFSTLVNGYNFGQPLFESAGEMCRRRASGAAAAEAADGEAADAPSSSLASWPLPSAPKNIFYWMKLERIPALGPGGMLRAFAEMRLSAALPPVATQAGDDAGGGGAAAQARIAAGDGGGGGRGSATGASGPHSRAQRPDPRGAVAGGAGRRGGSRRASPQMEPVVAATAAGAGTGAGADEGGGGGAGLLAAFRLFCVEQLKWEPVEVEAYLDVVGGEAELLAAAAATCEEGGGSGGEASRRSDPFPGAETAPADAVAAPPPPAQRQQRAQRPLQPLRSQGDDRGAARVAAVARRGAGPLAAVEVSGGGGGGDSAGRGQSSIRRWALCAHQSPCIWSRRRRCCCCCTSASAASLRPPQAAEEVRWMTRLLLTPARRPCGFSARYISSCCYSHSGSSTRSSSSRSGGLVSMVRCAPGPAPAGRMRLPRPFVTHGSVVGRVDARGGAALRSLVL